MALYHVGWLGTSGVALSADERDGRVVTAVGGARRKCRPEFSHARKKRTLRRCWVVTRANTADPSTLRCTLPGEGLQEWPCAQMSGTFAPLPQ